MWHDIGVAFALMLVLEGILPFLNPQGTRHAFAQLAGMGNRTVRVLGLISMVGGAMLLYLVK